MLKMLLVMNTLYQCPGTDYYVSAAYLCGASQIPTEGVTTGAALPAGTAWDNCPAGTELVIRRSGAHACASTADLNQRPAIGE